MTKLRTSSGKELYGFGLSRPGNQRDSLITPPVAEVE